MDGILGYINWIAIAVFFAGIALFFWRRRKKVQREFGFILLYRTQKGLSFVRKLATRFKGFWKAFGYIGIPVGFLAMVGILYILTNGVINMFAHPEAAMPSAGLVLPGAETSIFGPIIFVSIWYFLLGIGITILVHEGCHALVAKAHDFKLKSAGVGLMAVLPFAFVEPDEAQIEKAEAKKQLSIFAAGPFANICTAAIFILIAVFLLLPAISSSMHVEGIRVDEIAEDSPIANTSLEVGDIITQIDDVSFENIDTVPYGITFPPSADNSIGADKSKLGFLFTVPNQNVTIYTNNKTINVITATNPEDSSRGWMGINKMTQIIKPKPEVNELGIMGLGFIYAFSIWVFMFNLGIGLINLLPIGPLDGGRMVKTVLLKTNRKKLAKYILSILSSFSLLILILSIIGPYLVQAFI